MSSYDEPAEGCFMCGALDHWQRDCPYRGKGAHYGHREQHGAWGYSRGERGDQWHSGWYADQWQYRDSWRQWNYGYEDRRWGKDQQINKGKHSEKGYEKAPRRAKDVATREGMPLIVIVKDRHLHLGVRHLLLDLLLQATALVATRESSML
jgi:hypothetical protein